MADWLPFIMFFVLFGFILLGFPVAFTLGGTAILFGVIGWYFDLFYLSDFAFVPARIFGVMNNLTLMAVPLFIFMGMMLERSHLAEELLRSMEKLMRRFRGGLAISVVLVGMLLAASTGIVGATVITMGVLSLPVMLQRGYDKKLACGVISASGTLGQIIPPSIVLVVLGDMMNVDVGDLFTGALIPGLLLVTLYLVWILFAVILKPHQFPVEKAEAIAPGEFAKVLFTSLLPSAGLIVIVLGSIFTGIASPTEAAACGAVGAIVITFLKRRLSLKAISDAANETIKLTSMVFILLVGAQYFGVVFRGLEGDLIISTFIESMQLSPFLLLSLVLLLLFILGFFLDFIEVCFIVVPIVTPILVNLGYNPLWLAVLFAVNLQTSFLTPPFGFALFYLKGVVPKEVKTRDIYQGIVPFVAIQLFTLLLVIVFPSLVLYLPSLF